MDSGIEVNNLSDKGKLGLLRDSDVTPLSFGALLLITVMDSWRSALQNALLTCI